MNNKPWATEEIKFVKANALKGIEWLVANMNRSKYGIQRIAYVKGYSLNNQRNKNTKKSAPRKHAVKMITPDRNIEV